MNRGLRPTRLATRILVYYALAYLILIGLMGVIVDRSARGALLDEVDESLTVGARLAARSRPDDPDRYQDWARDSFDASGFRITLIDIAGVVLADSHSDPAVMENHLGRPEVQTALRGTIGEAQRLSASTGFEQRYVALPPEESLVVRTSVPTRVVVDELVAVRRSIVITAAVLGLLGVGLVAWLARRMAEPITELTRQARAVAGGEVAVSPHRSRIAELDQLGLAISTMARRLGSRISDAEAAAATLEVVLGALPQGTILIDGDDQVAYANPAAYSILGSVPSQLSGLVPLQLQTMVREARVRRDQETTVVEHGTPTRRLRGVATPFSGDDNVLLLVVDITERERVDLIRRDFVANASHELKTPVSTIIASSEALHMALERSDPSAAAFADRIEDSARQLDRLVSDLLDLSRLERETPEMSPLRLDRLVAEEVERARPDAEAKKVSLGLSSSQVEVRANQRDLAIATRNLLDNALRHTPEGGAIEVRVEGDRDRVMLSVADTGEGIPRRDLGRVFERFYRVDSARARATGGTGLGLAIVKHVAERHGGSVGVESELGVGSTFTLTLPATVSSEAPTGN